MTPAVDAILAGLEDPVHGAQQLFRGILEAMSRPGRPVRLAPLPESPAGVAPAAMAVLLCLLDQDTPLWLDPGLRAGAARHVSFHTQAPLVADLAAASFAVVADGMALRELSDIRLGDPAYPEGGATLIMQLRGFEAGSAYRFVGPGIDGRAELALDGLAPAFLRAHRANRETFPLGFDTILVADDRIVGLPRTIQVEEI